MIRTILVIAFLVGAGFVWQHEGYSQEASVTCLSGTIDLLYPSPNSIEELTSIATVVVKADVQSVFPSTPLSPRGGALVTDALFQSTQVFKGADIGRFVVRQLGGTQVGNKRCYVEYNLVQPNESYVMFLTPVSSSRAAKLEDRGVPRYDIVQAFYGAVRIENGVVIWAKGMSSAWHDRYDKMQFGELSSLLSSINQNSKAGH